MSRRFISIALSLTLMLSSICTITTGASAESLKNTVDSNATKQNVATSNADDPVELVFYSYLMDGMSEPGHKQYVHQQKKVVKANRGDEIKLKVNMKAEDEPYLSSLSIRYDLTEEDDIEGLFSKGGLMETSQANFIASHIPCRRTGLLEYQGIKMNDVIQEKCDYYYDDGDIFMDCGAFSEYSLSDKFDCFMIVPSEFIMDDSEEFAEMREKMHFTESEGGDEYCTITFKVSEDTSLGNQQTCVIYTPEFQKAIAQGNVVQVTEMTMDVTGSTYVEAPTEPPTQAPTQAPTEQPTDISGKPLTATKEVTVNKGDLVNMWVELTVPDSDKVIEGWAVDMYYDKALFQVNPQFANGKKFACGNDAFDYATGKSDVAVNLPGGTMTQANFEVMGESRFTDIAIGGMGLEGTTTKLVCIQLVAKESGTGAISFRMRDLINEDYETVYITPNTYQPKDGGNFVLNYEISNVEGPTAPETEVPTPAPTEPVTEAPTPAPTEPVEHTYFAVGGSPLFDPAWDPAAPNHQMFKNSDGIFEVVIPVTRDMWDSDIAYKVAQDGTWDVSYNDKGLAEGLNTDAFVYIEENVSAVRFTFNTDTLCASAECIFGEIPTEPEAPTEHTYFAVGSAPLFDPAWDPAVPKYQMSKYFDGSYEVTIPVTPDMWESEVLYKVAQDGNWDVSYNDEGVAEGVGSEAHLYIEKNVTHVTIWFDPINQCTAYGCSFGDFPSEPDVNDPTEPATEAPTPAPTEPAAPVEHTYFAVGASPLFDPAWDPAAPNHQMFKNDDGIFEVVIPVTEDMWDSDVAYKVAQDGTWDVSYNDKGLAEGLNTDAFVYIEADTTAVKITFNPETLCASAECITDKISAEPTEPTEAPTPTPTEPTEPTTQAPTEAPTAEPGTEPDTEPTTQAPTAEPGTEPDTEPTTQAPTEAPTQVVTTPTEAPTGTSTEAPTGNSTEAPTSSATSNNSSTGKVPTGDSTSVTILLSLIIMAAGAVVVAKRKVTTK
ncbi:MAG: hypothetical protein UH241_10010 [Acutalibacteraceae bacterium]|nr:hypothetical protein [Acutalibacteraceae bacterium]